MIFGRFFKAIAGLLVIIVFIRAVNGAGPVSLMEILVDFQEFEFDFDGFLKLSDLFKNDLIDGFKSWNHNLTGIDGFILNVSTVFVSFFKTLISILITAFRAFYGVAHSFVELVVLVSRLLSSVLGFRLSA